MTERFWIVAQERTDGAYSVSDAMWRAIYFTAESAEVARAGVSEGSPHRYIVLSFFSTRYIVKDEVIG